MPGPLRGDALTVSVKHPLLVAWPEPAKTDAGLGRRGPEPSEPNADAPLGELLHCPYPQTGAGSTADSQGHAEWDGPAAPPSTAKGRVSISLVSPSVLHLTRVRAGFP